MASITKTSYGTWKALVRKKGKPPVSKSFRTKRDAEDWARGVEDEMVRGIYIKRSEAERMSLDEAVKRYLSEVTPTKKPTSQVSDRQRARTLKTYFGKYSLAAITPSLVAEFRDKRLGGDGRKDKKGNPDPRPRSNNTVRLELALLGHIFTKAIKEWGLGLVVNPVTAITRPEPGEGRNRRLTQNEEGKLLDAVRAYSNPMLSWIVEIGLATGMRSGEITSLRRSQVDLSKRIVRLHETKNGTTRTVPLNKNATAVFREALNNPIRPIDVDLIFFGEPGRTGKRGQYQFNPAWSKIKKNLGLSDLRFHDLRHEAVSRLVEGGLSDQKVAAISGHRSMQMLKRYTHLRAEDLVEELDLIFTNK